MELTIDLETCKLIVPLERSEKKAIFISKLSGDVVTMTVSELIETLRFVARYKKQLELENEPNTP